MVSHPLDSTACSQADDVFYCRHPEMAPGGRREPLHPTSAEHRDMRTEWCRMYDDILAHNRDGSRPFPSCPDPSHDHHPADCPHCAEPPPPPPPDDPADHEDPEDPVSPCQKGRLVVRVTDADGAPVEGADVDVSGLGRRPTGPDGVADYGEVDAGDYDVSAHKTGHGPGRTDPVGPDERAGVSVPCNATTVVDLVQHEDWRVEFVTPGVDPVNSPNSTAGHNDQNEYTYSGATPGVLTITLRARVTPAGKVNEARPRVRFTVEAIDGSTLTWDGAGDGSATTVNGDMLEAVATFTGLPPRHDDFGRKTATLQKDGADVDSRDYEVFFPRDDTNHPNPGQGTTPNWYFYWSQISGLPNMRYDAAGGGGGVTPGMRFWSYAAAADKTGIVIHPGACARGRSYGIGVMLSGIDRVIYVMAHEDQHRQQVANADALVPTGDGCWRYGYSFNQVTHNHYGPGPDGLYGPAPGVAAAAVSATPPFVAGGGDDVSIDSATRDWPSAFGALPVHPGGTAGHPLEDDAIIQGEVVVPADHTFAAQDWGDPGKNHGTLNKWDD